MFKRLFAGERERGRGEEGREGGREGQVVEEACIGWKERRRRREKGETCVCEE